MPNKHFHYRGEYRIRTEWEGSTLLYEVFLGKGLAAMGFGMLSGDEQTAVEGILSRRNGGSRKRAKE